MIALNRSTGSLERELGRHRTEAIRAVNTAIGEARSAFITVIPGQEMIYQAKEAEAKVYLAASPEPTTLDGFPMLAAETGLTAPTPAALAHLWLNMSAQWRGIAAGLETLRLSAVAQIEQATIGNEIDAALATFAAGIAAYA